MLFALVGVCPPQDIGGQVGGFVSPDGKERMQCPLPGNLHQRNTGGSDGAGLCVYASACHTGRWQDDPLFSAIFKWMQKHPGGSYPEKFTATLKQCGQELGYPVPDYVQFQDTDIEVLKLACRNGFMPGVTYGYSPTGRYGGQNISHMVSLVHASDNWFAVLDNNYTGDNNFEWLKPGEFKSAHIATTDRFGRRIASVGWKWVLLTTPPPPKPYKRIK